jgi:hypothetical protein
VDSFSSHLCARISIDSTSAQPLALLEPDHKVGSGMRRTGMKRGDAVGLTRRIWESNSEDLSQTSMMGLMLSRLSQRFSRLWKFVEEELFPQKTQ